MRGTQDPVPKGYVGSNPTPRTKIAQNTFIISICAMEFYFFFENDEITIVDPSIEFQKS